MESRDLPKFVRATSLPVRSVWSLQNDLSVFYVCFIAPTPWFKLTSFYVDIGLNS